MRLGLASVLFAACTSPGISTYADNDPSIDNGGSGSGSCTANAFTVTPVTPYIELVVDGSKSMALDNLSDNTNEYSAVQKALLGGTGLLNNLQHKALFGAAVYTYEATCPRLYSTPLTANNLAGVTNALATGAAATRLYDPLEKALTAIVATLDAAPAGSKKAIILATDGVANSCGGNTDDPTPSVTLVTDAYNNNQIETYTIGFGNDNDNGTDANWIPFLTSMANAGAGGAGTMYNAQSLADVTADYTSIFNAVFDCEMTLDGTIDPAQASLGTVKSNGTTLAYTTDWTAVDAHTIKLVGSACTAYKAAATAPEITATFTCGSSQ